MKLSIVIPTYRGQDKIHSLLASILSWDDYDFECIVVDDGSDDNTCQTLGYFSHDSRLILLKQKNEGQAKARLNALKLCSSEYVLFLDDDDSCNINILVNFLRSTELDKDLYLFPYEYQVNNGAVQHSVAGYRYNTLREYKASLLYGACPHECFLWNRVFRKDILLNIMCEVYLYDAPGEDLALNLLYVDACDTFEVVDLYFYCYNVYSSSFTKTLTPVKYRNYVRVNDLLLSYLNSGFDDGAIQRHVRKNKTNIERFAARSVGFEQRITNVISNEFFNKTRLFIQIAQRSIKSFKFYLNGIQNFSCLKKFRETFDVASLEKTIFEIESGRSISRFGDGEMRLLTAVGDIGFQKPTNDMAESLQMIIDSDSKDVLVCLPNLSMDGMKLSAKITWASLLSDLGAIYNYFPENKEYGNAFISRPYIDYNSPKLNVFEWFKTYIEGKSILVVNGYNNNLHNSDLLGLAKNITRMSIPNRNSFCIKEQVSQKIKGLCIENKYDLVLLSCGPLASYLAYYHSCDVQCLDVGHIDIEYEWSKLMVSKKVAIDDTTCGEI